MRNLIAIPIGKATIVVSRLLDNSGSALPGLIAQKIAPDLLNSFSSQFKNGTIIVTGTNGKTTTTKMIAGILEGLGQTVFTNKTGSNFTRGILSALIDASTFRGRIKFDIAVIEVDEAYSGQLAKEFRPSLVTVTNIMRDQLDRYGEIDNTAQLISKTFTHSKGVVLNADDPPVANLGKNNPNGPTKTFYGAAKNIKNLLPSDEELLSRASGKSKSFTGQLDVTLLSQVNQTIKIKVGGAEYSTKLQFEGAHNAVNAAAALATAWRLVGDKLDVEKALASLSQVKPAFGRGEKIQLQDRVVHIALAKNPGGFNQNIRTLVNEDTRVALVLVNDNYADSRDVSWLWDVNFELMKKHQPTLIVGGTRAYDMALRFQYMGLEVDEVDQDINVALEHALSAGDSAEDVVVFPTYTAMLELRKILKAYSDKVEDIW